MLCGFPNLKHLELSGLDPAYTSPGSGSIGCRAAALLRLLLLTPMLESLRVHRMLDTEPEGEHGELEGQAAVPLVHLIAVSFIDTSLQATNCVLNHLQP